MNSSLDKDVVLKEQAKTIFNNCISLILDKNIL